MFGGYFDEMFAADTFVFFEGIKRDGHTILVSTLLLAEISMAPLMVQELLAAIPQGQIEQITLSQEAILLGDKYIEEKVVGRTSRADCQHIAMATINRADVLVSWNFKHIVNLNRIRGYNGINYQLGYGMIEIRTPKEVVDYGNES